MKKIIQSLSIVATGLTIAITIGSRSANASTFQFSQSGWENGGEITGIFTGEDKNGDNKIVFNSFDPAINEVSAYEMNFRGNSNFSDFTHSFKNDNLRTLEYILGGSIVIISTDGISSYDSEGLINNMGIISQAGDSITTDGIVNVSPKAVPEPAPWIGLMIFSLGAYFKRKITTTFFHDM